ncbi:MAG: GNAT family N-acetyltransferase [Cyclobacteriaceae bacterium]
MKTTVKKATIEDLDELGDLFNQYRVFYKKSSDVEAAKNFLKQRMEKGESEIFVTIDEKDRMTAFTQLYPLFSSTRMKRFWLLNDLFVHPEYRRKGYSVLLIEKAKDLCRSTEACGMMLETGKDNLEGNHLYPKTGFKLNEEQNFYSWDV